MDLPRQERAKPPEDISPLDFFTRWVPDAVASDPHRRQRLSTTRATVVFDLADAGRFTLRITEGLVHAAEGDSDAPDLRVRVDVETWRSLNRGDLSAPEALLRRRVRLQGDFILGLKLHLILG